MLHHIQRAIPFFKHPVLGHSKKRRRHHVPNQSDLRFPIEIWELILDFLMQTKTSLVPLLTINSALYPLVERGLYTHIDLSGDYLRHFNRRIRLFKRLAKHEHAALIVESLVFAQLKTNEAYNRVLGRKEADRYVAAFHGALYAMTNLSSLTIACISLDQLWVETWLLEKLFAGCKFRLRRLSIMPSIGRRLDFIERRQPFIEELTVNQDFEYELSTDAFPHLQVLQVTEYTPHIPQLVLAGHSSIRALYWSSRKPVLTGGPFSQITSLRFNTVVPFDVKLLCVVFPSLRYLRLNFYGGHGPRVVGRLIPLSNLLHLRGLAITVWGLSPADIESYQDLVPQLISEIPSLKSVSVGEQMWKRGAQAHVICLPSPDEWKAERWRGESVGDKDEI